ncbi:MAG: nucleotidyltransferase family protein [Paracoccaceae bacterium]
MQADLAILIPAAGASSRMGGVDKLGLKVGGEAALTRAVRQACATGAKVWVTLPESGAFAASRARLVAGHEAVVLPIPTDQVAEGMAASLRAGVGAAAAARVLGLMIYLPDMPEIEGADLQRLITLFAANPSRVVRATSDGPDGACRFGHPVILPKRLFDKIADLRGDRGARDIIHDADVVPCPLPGQRALLDLDRPEDWRNWSKEGNGNGT